MVLQPVEAVLVRVPVLQVVDVRRVPVDGDQRHARLDQAPGQQAALAEVVPAVAVAHGVRLGGQVEGPPRRRRLQQAEGLLVMAVHRRRWQPGQPLAAAVERRVQADPAAEAAGGRPRRAGAACRARSRGRVGSPVDEERGEAAAEQARPLAGHLAAVAVVQHRRQRDVGGHVARLPAEAGWRRSRRWGSRWASGGAACRA